MSSSSVTRTSVSYVSPNSRSISVGKSWWSPTSTRPSSTRRTAPRVAETTLRQCSSRAVRLRRSRTCPARGRRSRPRARRSPRRRHRAGRGTSRRRRPRRDGRALRPTTGCRARGYGAEVSKELAARRCLADGQDGRRRRHDVDLLAAHSPPSSGECDRDEDAERVGAVALDAAGAARGAVGRRARAPRRPPGRRDGRASKKLFTGRVDEV